MFRVHPSIKLKNDQINKFQFYYHTVKQQLWQNTYFVQLIISSFWVVVWLMGFFPWTQQHNIELICQSKMPLDSAVFVWCALLHLERLFFFSLVPIPLILRPCLNSYCSNVFNFNYFPNPFIYQSFIYRRQARSLYVRSWSKFGVS